MKRAFIIILILMNYFNLTGQKSISDLESFYLSELFKNVNKLKITEIVEKDELSNILRKWKFNKDGKLLQELDFRMISFSTSFGERIVDQSEISYTQIDYEYLQDGDLEYFIEKKKLDGKEFIIKHKFIYADQEIIENWEVKNIGPSNFGFEHITKFEGNKIDSAFFKSWSMIGENYSASIVKDVFKYNAGGNIETKNSYYKSRGISLEDLIAQRNYIYDPENKLIEVIDLEFDDESNEIVNKKISFRYNEESSKLQEIEINYHESYTPNFEIIKLYYQSDGLISSLINGDEKIHYEIKKE